MSESSSAEGTTPPAEEPAPTNRAARRGKGRAQQGSGAADRGFGDRARSAQGRRINPIRRTG